MGDNGRVTNPYAPPSERPLPEPDDAPQAAGPEPAPRTSRDPDVEPHRTPPLGVPMPTAPQVHAPGGRPTAPVALRDVDPDLVRRIGAAVRHFGVFLLAAVLVGTFPLPWRVAAVVFVAGAFVVGIRALILVLRAGMRGSLVPLLAVGLAFTAMLAVGTVGSVLFWSAETARQECLSGALTVSARSQCEQQYRDDLSQWQQDVRRDAGLSTGS